MPNLLNDLIAEAEPSVALIRCVDFGWQGTGFLVGDGRFVLTNNHVVREIRIDNGALVVDYSRDILVQLGAFSCRAEVVHAADERHPIVHDYAFLRLEGGKPASLAPLELDDRCRQGDEVVCLGFPLDFDTLVATRGIVSAIVARPSPMNSLYSTTTVVSDATIRPGNSGGPMLRLENRRVIGINTRRHDFDPGIERRLNEWASSTDAQRQPVLRDVVDYALRSVYVGLNHAVSVKHAAESPPWTF